MKYLSFMTVLTLGVTSASFAADKPNPFSGLPLQPQTHHQPPITPIASIAPIASVPSIASITPLRNDFKDLQVIQPILPWQELAAVKYVLDATSFPDTSRLPFGNYARRDILLSDGGKLTYSYSFQVGDFKPQFQSYYEKSTTEKRKSKNQGFGRVSKGGRSQEERKSLAFQGLALIP